MSHFYNKKSYTFAESDEKMLDIRKEMSNFITKEEAEELFNRRKMIVDPNPNFYHNKFEEMSQEIFNLKQEIYFLRTSINKIHNKIEFDEPTL